MDVSKSSYFAVVYMYLLHIFHLNTNNYHLFCAYTLVNQRDRRLLKHNSIYKYRLLEGHKLSFSLGDHSIKIVMELENFRDETDKMQNQIIISTVVKWMESRFVQVCW